MFEELKQWLRDAAVLFVLALTVRFLYLVSLSGDPWLSHPIVDEITYRNLALAAANGAWREWFPLAYAPLWPLVESLWLRVVGEANLVLMTRVLNALLGSLTVVLGYTLARQFTDRRTAMINGWICALAGVLVHLHTTGLATALFMVLLFLALLATLHASRQDKPMQMGFHAGWLWGLTAITRPVALPLAGVSLLWLAWTRRKHQSTAEVVSLVLIGMLGLMLPILPFTLLNARHGDTVLISSNGGINFFFGNYPGATGYMANHPDLGPSWSVEEAVHYASVHAGREMTESQASSWYFKQGLRNWGQHPVEMASLLGRKTILLLGGSEIGNNGDWRFFAEQRPVLRGLLLVGWWWLLPLAGLGAVISWRRKQRGAARRYLLLATAVYLLTVLAFFITTRFRAPVLPLLVPFAVIGIGWLLARERTLKQRLAAVLSVLVVLLGLNTLSVRLGPPPNRAYGALLQGFLHQDAGQGQQANHWFHVALDANPSLPAVNLYLGEAARTAGDTLTALTHYHAENAIQPNLRAYRGIGLIQRARAQHDSAAWAFERAYRLDRNDETIRLAYAEELGEVALSQAEKRNLSTANTLFTRAESLAPENPFFSFGRAMVSYLDDDPHLAETIVDSLLLVHPRFAPAKEWKNGWRPDNIGP